MNKENPTNNAKNNFIAVEWYVPHYTPSLEEYNKLKNQISEKTPTQLHYPERSVFMKEVNIQKFWTFELGTQESVNVPIWFYISFQHSDKI